MISIVKVIRQNSVRQYKSVLIPLFLTGTLIAQIALAEEEREEDKHEFHRHHVALLVGNTQSEDSSNGPSIGVDYEYRFNKWLGIGGLAEYAGGDFDHLLLIVPLYIHPYKGWLFNISLGTEVHKEHESHDEDKKKRLDISHGCGLSISHRGKVYHQSGIQC